MSSEDIFDDPLPANLSPPSISSTPIDLSGVEGTSNIVSAVTVSPACSSEGHTCPECRKILKTKSGFTRHLVLHKLNHYNLRKPVEDDIKESLPEILKKVLLEIKEEPSVGKMGAEKRAFANGFSTDPGCENVISFLNSISEPIINCVLVRTKVTPSAQYEAALQKVNEILAKPTFCDNIKAKMLLCVGEQLKGTSDNVLNRLVWRFTTKFLAEIQEKVFRQMREKHLSAQKNHSMQEDEKEVFKEHIEDMLRVVMKFGCQSQNAVWQLRCRCLLERFVESAEESSLSSEQFLDVELWGSRGSIVLSDIALNLFLKIEEIIQGFHSTSSACTADTVFDSLVLPENIIIFDYIRVLSRAILSEEIAIAFLKDLIKSVTALSSRLEAKKQALLASKQQRGSNVSLRGDLKRNPQAGQAREDSVSSKSAKGSAASLNKPTQPQSLVHTPAITESSQQPSTSGRSRRGSSKTPKEKQHEPMPSDSGPSQQPSTSKGSRRRSSRTTEKEKEHVPPIAGPSQPRKSKSPSSSQASSKPISKSKVRGDPTKEDPAKSLPPKDKPTNTSGGQRSKRRK